jgi:hypothetical protein
MTCEEVKFSLHDFFDELLDVYTKRNIESHLSTCSQCFDEYSKLKIFFDKLKKLPYSIEPPKEIIELFSQELLNRSFKNGEKNVEESRADTKRIIKEKEIQKKKLKHPSGAIRKSKMSRTMAPTRSQRMLLNKPGLRVGRIFFLLFVLAIIAAGYYIYDYQKINSPWEVRTIRGTVLINGLPNRSNKIYQDEILSTEENSIAEINIPKVGSITVAPNTKIIFERTKDGDNKISLELGTVKISNSNYTPSFQIRIKNHIVIDRSGEFSVTVDDAKNTNITVNYGFVEIQNNEENIFMCKGFICNIRNGDLACVPYRLEASDSLKKELIIFNAQANGDDSIEKIIPLTKQQDAPTLLTLIPRASQLKRQSLYQAIANYFPPPEGVTRMGIIKGDSQMLFLWWQDIEWQL